MKLSPILRSHEQDGIRFMLVNCPGCKRPHYIPVKRKGAGNVWDWNCDLLRPTFSPDLVVKQPAHRTNDGVDMPERVLCRSTITDGCMTFHEGDHGLTGTHDLLPFKHPEDLPPLPKLDKPKVRA